MSTGAPKRWIIKDSNGIKHGKPIYESKEEAERDLPKLQESLGTSASDSHLQIKEVLLE